MRPRRAILEPGVALGEPATPPLTDRGPRHPHLGSDMSLWSSRRDSFDENQTAGRGERDPFVVPVAMRAFGGFGWPIVGRTRLV
jgi:hypothetical protein